MDRRYIKIMGSCLLIVGIIFMFATCVIGDSVVYCSVLYWYDFIYD
ncbi:MAG: hypothetical protein ACLT90_04140 [Enterococcus raffinosus]